MLFSLKQIPIPEIVRYALGTALPSPIPQEFLSLAQNAAQEVLSCCQPKYHLVRYPVQPLLDSFLTGEDIRRHLSGCSDCVLLCATLGSEVDALIRRTQVTDMAKTLWLDAAASRSVMKFSWILPSALSAALPPVSAADTGIFRCLLSRTFYPVWMPDEKSGCT